MKHDIPLFRAYVHCKHHHLEKGQWVDQWVLGDVSIYYDRKRGVRVSDGSITGNHDYIEGENCIIMRFTGCFDKHGIPIYEDDILNTHWLFESQISTVVCPALGPNSFHWYSELDDLIVEVIGNKHENPDLILQKSN